MFTPRIRSGKLKASLLATLALSGCAVGPNFRTPQVSEKAGYAPGPLPTKTASASGALGGAQDFVQNNNIPGQWWTLFQSPVLDGLIKQAMAANPTINAAQASLRMAQENALAQEGSLFPSIGLGLSASKNETSTGSLAPIAANYKPFYSLYTGEVTVSYAPDVFGLNRRTIESMAAQAEIQRYQLDAAYLTLTSNVVMTAVQVAALQAEISAQEDTIKADSQMRDIIRSQYAVGEVAEAALVQQDAVLAQAQQMLPPLQKQLALQQNALTALEGNYPTQAPVQGLDLTSLHLPEQLPVSLPSELVAQRPDILAAAANMHAASAQIGVAIANRLPQFPLTAALGTSPAALAKAFTPYNQFFTIASGLTMPLFDGGTLLHKQRAAKAQFDLAAAQYRETVIGAFQNVSDVLRALQSDADELQAAQAAQVAAAHSLTIARQELQAGSIDYVYVLTAEQTYQTAQQALVQAEAMRLSDTAALFQSLGGGWWNRSDPTVESSAQMASN
jgi:NodT family efflux transporter outer membrane factor (OMF) lipoprotein